MLLLSLLLFVGFAASCHAEILNDRCTNTAESPHFSSEIIQIPNHHCKCSRKEEGTLRYRNGKLEICNGNEFVNVCGVVKTKAGSLGSETFPARSCREILDEDSKAESGMYNIKVNGDKTIKTYCYMGTICGSKGWTMIMKMDGYKPTFKYDSKYWTDKHTYNQGGAAGGLDTTETKLDTYTSFGFTKLCLGMKTGQQATRWSQLNYKASSLYALIADNRYRPTNMGRSSWKSLISGASLQRRCNREGFNVRVSRSTAMARIGIVGNNENNCRSPDSRIGFGTQGTSCRQKNDNSAGNEARCGGDTGNKNIRSFGYIFAQERLGPTDTPLGSYDNPATSCLAIKAENTLARSGAYYLDLQNTTTRVHCHMENTCGSRGWTMLMKIDGSKRTFHYDSSYWKNENVLNAGAVSEGLNTNTEIKLLTYSKLPFTKLCIGMKTGSQTRWLPIVMPKKVASLRSIIASNKFVATGLGRNAWKGLVPGSSLQRHCSKEGFNSNPGRRGHARARIGIVGNNENDCVTPDSRIGLGTGGHSCGQRDNLSAGNEARCGGDNGNRSIRVIGYILAL